MNATSSPKPMRERLRATATVLKAQLAAINAMLEEMATMIDDEPQPPRQAEEPGKGRLLNGGEAAEYLGISPKLHWGRVRDHAEGDRRRDGMGRAGRFNGAA
jgi:hypothetical protein